MNCQLLVQFCWLASVYGLIILYYVELDVNGVLVEDSFSLFLFCAPNCVVRVTSMLLCVIEIGHFGFVRVTFGPFC